jgi:hypothetical protein
MNKKEEVIDAHKRELVRHRRELDRLKQETIVVVKNIRKLKKMIELLSSSKNLIFTHPGIFNRMKDLHKMLNLIAENDLLERGADKPEGG